MVDFTSDVALRDKLKALARSGSPNSRAAAMKLLRGDRPTTIEYGALMSYIARGKPRGKSINDQRRDP